MTGVAAPEHLQGTLMEIDDDLPLLMHEFPDGFSAAQLAEFYGSPIGSAKKMIGTLILRGALTMLKDEEPERFVAAETARDPIGVSAGRIATLTGSSVNAVLEEIKAACAADRITHTQHEGRVFYVRSKRPRDFRKPSDWLTAKDKKEAPVSTVSDIRQKVQALAASPPAASPSKTPPRSDGKVARTTAGLRDALFDALDDLRGPKPDVAKALATAKIAQAIITSAKAEMDFHDRLNRDKQLETDFTSEPLKLGSDGA